MRQVIGGLFMLAAIASIGPAKADGALGLDQSVIDAANKEGLVSLYTAQTDAESASAVAAFHKAFPSIEVKWLRPGASGVLVSRYIQEMQSGVSAADVVDAQTSQLFTDHKDWFLPLTSDYVPTIKSVNAKFVYGDYIATLQSPLIFAYNTNLLPAADVPKTWDDILDARFKGKGLIPDPRNSDVYVNWLDMLAHRYGDDYLTKLKGMNLRIVSGGVPGAQEISAGGSSSVFMVGLFPSHVVPMLRKHAPIKMVNGLFKASGMPTLENVNFFALPRKAPHPNAARVFFTWLISRDGQKADCAATEASLLLPNDDRGDCLETDSNEFVSADKQPDPARKAQILSLLGLQ